MSTDPHHELKFHMDHYIGIDVGTGSARACIINNKGDIVGLASENIGLWQPEQGYYVRPTFLAAPHAALNYSSGHEVHRSLLNLFHCRSNQQTTYGDVSARRSSKL